MSIDLSRLKVALIHDHLNQGGGAEKVLQSLHALFPNAPIYTLLADPDLVQKMLPGARVIESFIPRLPFGRKRFKWYLPLMPIAFERFDLSQYDLVISNCSAWSKSVLTPPGVPHISYILSPTRYLWSDANSYVLSQQASWIEKMMATFLLPILRLWDRLAAERPDYLFGDSQFIRERIQTYYKRGAGVLYPPADVEDIPLSYHHDGPYVAVGRLRPYKRFDLAIAAANAAQIPLIIVGGGEEEARLRAMAGPTVKFVGSVPDAERNRLIGQARALLFPQEEDYGIVPVEAQAAGTPVIAFGSGGALETVIDGETGVFFDKQTTESLVLAIQRSEGISFDPQKIRNNALSFSRTVFERNVREIVEACVADYRTAYPISSRPHERSAPMNR